MSLAINTTTLAKAADSTSYSGAAASRDPIRSLGQEDFLNLLITQMKAQDPMNPQKDTDFIAQMAQFSSLEQAKAMQADIAGLRSDQELVQANGLIGRAVVLQIDDNTVLQGIVSGVQIASGSPQIIVSNHAYDLSQLVSVAAPQQPKFQQQ